MCILPMQYIYMFHINYLAATANRNITNLPVFVIETHCIPCDVENTFLYVIYL
jgi:hypothetical protein